MTARRWTAGWQRGHWPQAPGRAPLRRRPPRRAASALAPRSSAPTVRTTCTARGGRDVIVALDGNDEVEGRGGKDLLCGGGGHDELRGDQAADRLSGGARQRLRPRRQRCGRARRRIGPRPSPGRRRRRPALRRRGPRLPRRRRRHRRDDGGAGNDFASGGTEADVIRGGGDDDFLDGGSGKDLVRGGDDDDSLDGGSGRDELQGDAGDDLLSGEAAADRLDGGPGSAGWRARRGSDQLRGEEGDDVLAGDRAGAVDEETRDDVIKGGPDHGHRGAGPPPAGRRPDRGRPRRRHRDRTGRPTSSPASSRSRCAAITTTWSLGSDAANTISTGGGDDQARAGWAATTTSWAPRVTTRSRAGSAMTPSASSRWDAGSRPTSRRTGVGYRLGDRRASSRSRTSPGSPAQRRPHRERGAEPAPRSVRSGHPARDGRRRRPPGRPELGRSPTGSTSCPAEPGDDLLDGHDVDLGACCPDNRDQVDYSTSASPVTVDLATGTASRRGRLRHPGLRRGCRGVRAGRRHPRQRRGQRAQRQRR